MIKQSRCLLFFVLVFFPVRALLAQSGIVAYSYSITIDIQNVTSDKDRVKVTITPPALQGPKVRYVLPQYLPGVSGPVNAGRFVHQFYALDDKGFPLKVKKKGENVIEMKLRRGATLKKIEYWIDDTWDMEKPKERMTDEKFNYVTQAAGTNIDAGNNFLLNHAFVFGYLEGLANIPYHVTIIKPDALVASSALHINHLSRSKDEYNAATYFELVDSPVMYCVPDTIDFQTGHVRISISVYSENGKVSARLVRRLIASEVTASTNFIGEVPDQTYYLIFYFTTPFKTVLNSYGTYSGLAHKHSTFYFLPELADEDKLGDEVQRVTSGDVLHLLPPLDYMTFCGQRDLLKPQLTKSCWFCEGANMYFGWLAAVRDSFVSENDFMGMVSSSIRLSTLLPSRPVSDVEFAGRMSEVPLRKEAYKAKCMLLAFLLDIEITRLTDGNTGLREVVLRLGKSGSIDSDSLEKKIIAMTDPRIADFFRKYVHGTEPLPLISKFDQIGWAYAPSSIDSVLTFGKFGLLYDDGKDAFIVHNSDTNNLFRLHDGDRLVSVNGNIIGALDFESALSPIYSPRNDDPVTLQYIHNDQSITVSVSPVVIAVSIEHLIKSDPAASDDAYLLHERIFHPRL